MLQSQNLEIHFWTLYCVVDHHYHHRAFLLPQDKLFTLCTTIETPAALLFTLSQSLLNKELLFPPGPRLI